MVIPEYKNKNRGYQQLRVWQDAIAFYRRISEVSVRIKASGLSGAGIE